MTYQLISFIGPEIIVLFFGLILTAISVLTVWTVIEIASKPFVNDKDKVLWLIIVLLLGGIGPLIYLSQRKRLLAKDNLELSDLNTSMSKEAHALPRGTRDEDFV